MIARKWLFLAMFAALPVCCPPAHAISTTMSYQGLLDVSGQPATGSFDLQFTLLDSAGVAVVAPIVRPAVSVAAGLFAVELDFGLTAFTGGNRLLQIAVRPGGSAGAFTVLTPSTRINPAPYAQLAADALVATTVADNAVTSAKIANGSVTGADIAASTITAQSIAPSTITGSQIANGSITDADIAASTITGQSIASNTVGSSQIANLSITDVDIADNTISGQSIAANTITSADLADNAVTSAKIANGTITSGDVASNQFWRADGNAGTSAVNQFLGTTDGAPLRLQAGGGVGINVSAPQAQLHVNYNAAFVDNEVARFGRASTGESVRIAVPSGRPELRFSAGGTGYGSIGYNVFSGSGFNGDTLTLGDAEGSLALSNSFAFGAMGTTLFLRGPGAVSAEKPGGGAWSAPSDRRLKHAVEPLEHALEHLLQLRGVTFEYNDAGNGRFPSGRQTGFIAQEVQPLFPNWVDTGRDGFLTVGAKGFEALAVEALRELRVEKDVEVAALRQDNAALRARLEAIEAKLASQQ